MDLFYYRKEPGPTLKAEGVFFSQQLMAAITYCQTVGGVLRYGCHAGIPSEDGVVGPLMVLFLLQEPCV